MNYLRDTLEQAQAMGLLKPNPDSEKSSLVPTSVNSNNYDLVRGIRNSELSYLKQSALHWKAYQDGQLARSPALLTGQILHSCTLEPRKFYKQFAPKANGRSKAGKAENERRVQEGKVLISESDFEMMMGVIQSLESSAEIKDLLKRARIEKVLCWQNEELACKAKIDLLIPQERLADFKFVRDARPEKLPRLCESYDYDRQMAWYLSGAVAHGLATWFTPVSLVCIEKTPPYAFTILDLDPAIIQQGRAKYEVLLDEYRRTIAQGQYPGYPRTTWEPYH